MIRLVLLLQLLMPLAAQALPPLPDSVFGTQAGVRFAGEGRLRWLGLHIYDAALWTRAENFQPDSEFALDIHYARNVSARRLVRTSIKEMRRLGFRNSDLLARWKQNMTRVFPDIRKGDRLTGVNRPGEGVELFYNGRSVGLIADQQFARAFFSIWLDPRTREPGLRESLIGKS